MKSSEIAKIVSQVIKATKTSGTKGVSVKNLPIDKKCIAWVSKKLKAKYVSSKDTTYVRQKDGEKINVKALSFDNGDTFLVSETRFWKQK